MKRRALCAAVVATMALASCARAGAAHTAYLEAFAQAETAGKTFPAASETITALDFDGAYALQKMIVRAREKAGDAAVGYKGGIMSAKSLADRGVKEPVTGILFASGDTGAGEMSLCGYRRAAFELKLGYVFASPVRAAVGDVADLKSKVAYVQPVIDLPDIAYNNEKTYNAIDMVAANVSSARFVRGAPASKDAVDLDALEVSVARDGASVTRGLGRESLGGQWGSLRTVVNLIIARGGEIKAGQTVITGKIGDKGDLVPGRYEISYGRLGDIALQVVACPGGKLATAAGG